MPIGREKQKTASAIKNKGVKEVAPKPKSSAKIAKPKKKMSAKERIKANSAKALAAKKASRPKIAKGRTLAGKIQEQRARSRQKATGAKHYYDKEGKKHYYDARSGKKVNTGTKKQKGFKDLKGKAPGRNDIRRGKKNRDTGSWIDRALSSAGQRSRSKGKGTKINIETNEQTRIRQAKRREQYTKEGKHLNKGWGRPQREIGKLRQTGSYRDRWGGGHWQGEGKGGGPRRASQYRSKLSKKSMKKN